jgi:hypothetical protein
VNLARALVALAVVLASGASPARAQEAAPPLQDDPRAPRFAEVERGFFTGFEAGWLHLFDSPTADRAKYPFAGESGGAADGFMMGAHVGLEVTDRVALALFASGSNAQASASYGAFSLVAVGVDVRLSLLGRRDRNGVERFHAYVHGRGGWLATRPSGLFGTSDVLVSGGPGVEYFTRLRHFSIGLATDLAYVVDASTLGVAVLPTVRYTF